MRLDSLAGPKTESSSNESLSFGISEGNHGMILDILRSKIYEDPEGSICREIASNARDANREVGKGHIPIKIAIIANNPFVNSGSETIVFTDNGPGMDSKMLKDVYTQFGESTRRESNNFTGGFGLGAKTPFSYTDSFTVISTVKGEQKHWVCYIDESKKGRMDCIHTENVTTGDGISVCIPIKSSDRHKFQYAVIRNTMFWDVLPTLTGFSIAYPEREVYHECDTWFLCKRHNNVDSQIIVLIDGIAYKLNQDPFNKLFNYEYGLTIAMPFDNGDLAISANRETLHMNDATTRKLMDRLLDIKNEITSSLNSLFADCTSHAEAGRKYAMLNSNNWGFSHTVAVSPEVKLLSKFKALIKDKPTWNGEAIVSTMALSFHGINRFMRTSDGKLERVVEPNAITATNTCFTAENIYFLDGRRSARMDHTAFERCSTMFIVRAKNYTASDRMDKAVYLARQAEEMATLLKHFDVQKYSDLDKAKTYSRMEKTEDVSVSVRTVNAANINQIGQTCTDMRDSARRRGSRDVGVAKYGDTVKFNKKTKVPYEDDYKNVIYLVASNMAQLDNCRDSIITGLYCAKYFNMRFVIVGARSAVYMHGNGMSVAEAWAKAKGDPNGYISSVRAADVWAANLILMNLTFGDSSEVGTAIATLNRCRSGNITSPVTSNDVASLRSVYSDAELVTPEIRDAMLTIEQIRSRYPLLKYYFSENTDHYNLYIKAVNANTATLA